MTNQLNEKIWGCFICCFCLFSVPSKGQDKKEYSIEQATSERAQLHTIAFNGLAFMTGNGGADCFFPPGKLTDYFGFQYMRDNDKNEMGHNTDFLTNIAHNVLSILNKEQIQELINLAVQQEKRYDEFAYKRILLIKAFRNQLENKITGVGMHLNKDAVEQYCGSLYQIDGSLSYERAVVVSHIIHSLTALQKEQFNQLAFDHSDTWTPKPENFDKKSMSHRAHVCLMTYASELFSWYKGSLTSDVYFCPERHGTYFGGFYMKDYPAMNNHGYNIPTSLTGNSGRDFIELLTPEQRKEIEILPDLQKKSLQRIVEIRTEICTQLRKCMQGEKVNEKEILDQSAEYGKLDGGMSYLYAMAFTKIYQTLCLTQLEKMKSLRNQHQLPEGIYLFSDPIPVSNLQSFFNGELNTDHFFSY